METNKIEDRVIWQDPVYEDDSQWLDAYEEHLNDNGMTKDQLSLYDFICESCEVSLDDERCNLDIDVPEGILVFGSVGLWYGTRNGYSAEEPTNIKDCLCSRCDGYMKFLVKDGEFVAEESHHDGQNSYVFRAWKSGVTEEEKDAVKDALTTGADNLHELLNRHTESLAPRIAAVYGW